MGKIKERPITIRDFQKAGVPITPGNEYFKDWPHPRRKVSLERVQKILSKIPGSLSEEVAKMREEEGRS